MLLTVAERNALPYEGRVNAPPSTPMPVEERNALPYDGASASAKGITSGEIRQFYAQVGEPLCAWRGIRVPPGGTGPNGEMPESNGRAYVKILMAADGVTPLSAIRVRFYEQREDEEQVADIGGIPDSQMMLGILPDDLVLWPGDRVNRSSAVQWFPAAGRVTRGDGDGDALPAWPVLALDTAEGDSVNGSGGFYAFGVEGDPAGDVRVSANGQGLEWLTDNRPAEGESYFVRWRYSPLYEIMPNVQDAPIGSDGKRLPLRYVLQEVGRASE